MEVGNVSEPKILHAALNARPPGQPLVQIGCHPAPRLTHDHQHDLTLRVNSSFQIERLSCVIPASARTSARHTAKVAATTPATRPPCRRTPFPAERCNTGTPATGKVDAAAKPTHHIK
jgi:hypothetical protein